MEPMQLEEDDPRGINWRQFFRIETLRDKAFLTIICILALISLALMITLIAQPKTVQLHPICETVECIKASNHILSFVNQSADPCDDFYKFACGNFHKNYVERKKQNDLEEMEDVLERTLDQLLIDIGVDDRNFSINLKIARKFYQACMDTTAINRNQDTTFLEILDNVTGGWPVKDNRSFKRTSWQNATLKAREYGLPFDFFLNVSIATMPDSTKMLMIAPPAIETFWFNALWNVNNLQYFQEIAKYWHRQDSNIYLETEKTLQFANKLYEIITESNGDIEFLDENDRLRPISQLNHTKFVDMDWLTFLRNLTGLQSLKKSDVVSYLIYDDSRRNYLENLYYLIEKTDDNSWINYVVVSYIMQNCRLLSEAVQNVCYKIMPMWDSTSREGYCRDFTQAQFVGEQDREYVRQTLSDEKRNHVQAMINNIKSTLETSLQLIPLLQKTKIYALDKLRNMTSIIGSGHISFNNTLSKEQYGKAVSNNVVEMYFKIKKIDMNFAFNLIQKPTTDEEVEEMEIPTMGANMYFEQVHNTLYVPAPVLQEPIYQENRPQYLNYGSLGSIIGHELIHALLYPEVITKQYIRKENSWKLNFLEYRQTSAKCEYDNYLNYLLERDLPTNTAQIAMDESYADFGGINLAYKAYQTWLKEHGHEQRLPGVNYTSNQIFWIMSSIYLCYDVSMDHPERMREYLNSDEPYNYAIPSYRINGPKRNSPYFADDFGCKPDTKMNPTSKCDTIA